MMVIIKSVLFAAIAMISSAARADPYSSATAANQCENLAKIDFADLKDAPTRVTEANVYAARSTVPTFCEARGYVAPQVGFAVRLPVANWNEKVVMLGCGGMCGAVESVIMACDMPLRKGYACIVTDAGHRGEGSLWAYNNPQAVIDLAFRSIHVATLAGRAIVNRYYGATARRSYFMGCSGGGLQGLSAAQRFPWDFDGILVGAPIIDFTQYLMNFVHAQFAMQGKHEAPAISRESLRLLHNSALATCDSDDGVVDGIIGNPLSCKFDPEKLLCSSKRTLKDCLTAGEITAARKMYAVDRPWVHAESNPVVPIGSELLWTEYFGRDMTSRVTDALRYLSSIADQPQHRWELSMFDAEHDFKRLGMMGALFSASNPDLRQFKAVGGKIMIYVGWNDALIMPSHVIDYYETVQKVVGGQENIESFMKLYLLPGVAHCAGGEGADAVNFLDYLDDWVERDVSPNELLSGHFDEAPQSLAYPYREFSEGPGKAKFTRPLYPYPLYAVYSGYGDVNVASSFKSRRAK